MPHTPHTHMPHTTHTQNYRYKTQKYSTAKHFWLPQILCQFWAQGKGKHTTHTHTPTRTHIHTTSHNTQKLQHKTQQAHRNTTHTTHNTHNTHNTCTHHTPHTIPRHQTQNHRHKTQKYRVAKHLELPQILG